MSIVGYFKSFLPACHPMISDDICLRGNVPGQNFYEFACQIYNDSNISPYKIIDEWNTITKGKSELSKTERKDCTVFCIAVAFSISYDMAHKYMRKKGREYQKGYDNWEETVLTHLENTCKIVELDKTRYTYKNRKNETSRFRVMTFMKQNTNGIYIITTKYHVLCIRYGVLIDRFDSSHYIIQQVHQVCE
jgi:hypothetical protein